MSAGLMLILLGAGWNGPGDAPTSAGRAPTASEKQDKSETSETTSVGASDVAGGKSAFRTLYWNRTTGPSGPPS